MHFTTSDHPSDIVSDRLHGEECCWQLALNIWVEYYSGIFIDPAGPLSMFVKRVLQNLVVFPVATCVIFVKVPYGCNLPPQIILMGRYCRVSSAFRFSFFPRNETMFSSSVNMKFSCLPIPRIATHGLPPYYVHWLNTS